jgi:uncharacterized membrane protein YdbT with pleckstrin-like domain
MKQFNLYNEKEVSRLKSMYFMGEREKVIDVVCKHPAYLILVFVITIFAYVLVLLATFFLVPALFNNNSEAVYRTTSFVALSMAILIGLILVVAIFLYSQTKVIVSSENLIEVIQKDLFHGKTARLALTEIEDVTAEQHGYLAILFGYGNLVIETAGAQVNFVFRYCPRPNYVAKEIIDAKEKLIGVGKTRGS